MWEWIKNNPKETLLIIGVGSSLLLATFCFGFTLDDRVEIQETILFIKEGIVECNKALTQVIQATLKASDVPLSVDSIAELQAYTKYSMNVPTK